MKWKKEVTRCPYCGFILGLGYGTHTLSTCPNCEKFSWIGTKSHASRIEIFRWKRMIQTANYYVSKQVRKTITQEGF